MAREYGVYSTVRPKQNQQGAIVMNGQEKWCGKVEHQVHSSILDNPISRQENGYSTILKSQIMFNDKTFKNVLKLLLFTISVHDNYSMVRVRERLWL